MYVRLAAASALQRPQQTTGPACWQPRMPSARAIPRSVAGLVERRFIEEVGTMNIMLKMGNEIVTPPLSDSILPGVTRLSALQLMREWGLTVSERQVDINDLIAGVRSGLVDEVWGVGTAAVVSPVGQLSYRDETVVVGDGKTGSVTQRLYDTVTRLHTMGGDDPYGWRVDVTKGDGA